MECGQGDERGKPASSFAGPFAEFSLQLAAKLLEPASDPSLDGPDRNFLECSDSARCQSFEVAPEERRPIRFAHLGDGLGDAAMALEALKDGVGRGRPARSLPGLVPGGADLVVAATRPAAARHPEAVPKGPEQPGPTLLARRRSATKPRQEHFLADVVSQGLVGAKAIREPLNPLELLQLFGLVSVFFWHVSHGLHWLIARGGNESSAKQKNLRSTLPYCRVPLRSPRPRPGVGRARPSQRRGTAAYSQSTTVVWPEMASSEMIFFPFRPSPVVTRVVAPGGPNTPSSSPGSMLSTSYCMPWMQ